MLPFFTLLSRRGAGGGVYATLVQTQIYTNMLQSAPHRTVNPLVSLLMLVSFFFLGQLAGGFVGLVISVPLVGGDPLQATAKVMRVLQTDFGNVPRAWLIMMVLQAFSSAGGFILAVWAYLFFIEGRKLRSLNTQPYVRVLPIFLILFLGLAFIFFNEWIYQWNRNWDLPGWLDGFENWSRRQQEKIGELTKFLTQFDSVGKLLLGLLIIAVIPAIGEELFFRGVVQSIFLRWTKNAHWAVWITGVLFSFIHFQLDGFVPRMLLGVVFGYLYVWSGNIWYPIWAHFVNNGITVLGVYLNRNQAAAIDLENTEWISWSQGLAAMAASALLLWYLKRVFDGLHGSKPAGGGV